MLLIHSVVRWVVAILGILIVVKFAAGWLGKKPWTQLDTRLSLWFMIGMDIQILIGLVLLVWSGLSGAGFPRERFEHAFMMILALAATHVPARWKSLDDDAKRFRNSLFAYALAILFIVIGVAVLPGGGWGRMFPPMFSLP
jgi:hypothetical protein